MLGVALFLRILAVADVVKQHGAVWLFNRGLEISLLARSLLAGRGLSSPFGPDTGPTALIAPAYPIFVAGVFRLFGSGSAAAAYVVMGLHIAANLATIWLMMHVARKVFDETAAVLAGSVWAVSPPLLLAPTIFWETSFSCCLVMGLVALALWVRDFPVTRAWILLGAYCGLMALVNPALLLSACGMTVVLASVTWRLLKLRDLILSFATFALVFAAWPIRNARVFHAFVPLRTTVGLELWMGNHAGSQGYLDESLFPTFNATELQAYRRQGEIDYTNGKTALAIEYIEAHPGTFLTLSARRMARFWAGTGTAHGSPVLMVHALMTSLLGLLGVCALIFRRRWRIALLLTTPVMLFPLPYYITHAEFRYRLVIDPLLTVLGAIAVQTFRSRRSRTAV